MIKRSRFKYINNGKGPLAVIIPGWATDSRIFEKLDLNHDIILPEEIVVDDFPERLKDPGV